MYSYFVRLGHQKRATCVKVLNVSRQTRPRSRENKPTAV